MKYLNTQILNHHIKSTLILGIFAAPLCVTTQAQASVNEKQPQWAKGRILVAPVAGLPATRFKQLLNKHGAKSNGRLHATSNTEKLRTHIINVPPHAERAIVRALRNNPNIEFAELDTLISPSDIDANDTYYASAWHLDTLNLPTAWHESKGDNVVVAVIDAGVNSAHQDLNTNTVAGWNVINNNNDTSDVSGHGTKVAGVIAAKSDNGIGVTSIAWNSSIMPIRVTNNTNGTAYTSDMAKGVIWAVEHGASIANISFAVTTSATLTNAANYMRANGGLVVVSSGNNGSQLTCDDNPSMITVGGTDQSDNKASWSNYGACIDVVAPGAGIWTTHKSGSYASVSGTSFAAPATAAVLALIKSANPNLSPDELESILERSADKSNNGGSYSTSLGHGRIDAAAAVAMAIQAPNIDQQAPTVSINSIEQASDKNVFNISINAQDNNAVSHVELYADGELIGTDLSAPYQFNYDGSDNVDAQVQLWAVAYDASNNQGQSEKRSVELSQEPVTDDTTPPTLDIFNPTDGSTLSGTVTISANAADDRQLASISLTIDGQLKTHIADNSLSYGWNTRKVSLGAHTIVISATDSAGNKTTQTRTITLVAKKKGRKGR